MRLDLDSILRIAHILHTIEEQGVNGSVCTNEHIVSMQHVGLIIFNGFDTKRIGAE